MKLELIKSLFFSSSLKIFNQVVYAREGINDTDIITCSIPKISEILVLNGLARKKSKKLDGVKQNVIVTCAKSPLDFWITFSEKYDVIETISKFLDHDYFEKISLESIKVGMFCVARSSCNKPKPKLMRAQILFIEPADFCIVHLIDFGERERITTQEIFKLPNNLRNIQAQAKNVALSGIKIKDKCAMMSCDKDWI